jgi:hypothetical protein
MMSTQNYPADTAGHKTARWHESVADITGEADILCELCRVDAAALGAGGFDMRLLDTLRAALRRVDETFIGYTRCKARELQIHRTLGDRYREARKMRDRLSRRLFETFRDYGIRQKIGSLSRNHGMASIACDLSTLKELYTIFSGQLPEGVLDKSVPGKIDETLALLDNGLIELTAAEHASTGAYTALNTSSSDLVRQTRMIRRAAKNILDGTPRAAAYINYHRAGKKKKKGI